MCRLRDLKPNGHVMFLEITLVRNLNLLERFQILSFVSLQYLQETFGFVGRFINYLDLLARQAVLWVGKEHSGGW